MHEFKDNANPPRLWMIHLHIGLARRLRTTSPAIDILQAGAINEEFVAKIFNDPVYFCELLCAICKPQIDDRKITDDDFYDALGPEAIVLSRDALLQEIVDFFLRSGREPEAEALSTLLKALGETKALMLAKLRSLDVKKLSEAVGKPFIDALESLESTPTRSLSEN